MKIKLGILKRLIREAVGEGTPLELQDGQKLSIEEVEVLDSVAAREARTDGVTEFQVFTWQSNDPDDYLHPFSYQGKKWELWGQWDGPNRNKSSGKNFCVWDLAHDSWIGHDIGNRLTPPSSAGLKLSHAMELSIEQIRQLVPAAADAAIADGLTEFWVLDNEDDNFGDPSFIHGGVEWALVGIHGDDYDEEAGEEAPPFIWDVEKGVWEDTTRY